MILKHSYCFHYYRGYWWTNNGPHTITLGFRVALSLTWTPPLVKMLSQNRQGIIPNCCLENQQSSKAYRKPFWRYLGKRWGQSTPTLTGRGRSLHTKLPVITVFEDLRCTGYVGNMTPKSQPCAYQYLKDSVHISGVSRVLKLSKGLL